MPDLKALREVAAQLDLPAQVELVRRHDAAGHVQQVVKRAVDERLGLRVRRRPHIHVAAGELHVADPGIAVGGEHESVC